ncbi:MAG: hypothetical protein ACRENF_07085, partial [Thermodesulfobacteriota bacterium]
MIFKWKHLFLAALSFFLLDALVFGADDLKLRVYPKVGLAPLKNVILMVEIKDPEIFWCPSIEVTWWEGN